MRYIFIVIYRYARRGIYLAAINLKRARDREASNMTKELPNSKLGDLVLLKNQKKQNWDARYTYMPNFCIHKIISERAYDTQDPTGHVRNAAVADIQL